VKSNCPQDTTSVGYLNGISLLGTYIVQPVFSRTREGAVGSRQHCPCLFCLFSRDPLANIADVVPQPIFGPSLSIGGQTAQWNGQRTGVSGQVGVACRVIFDANVGDRITSYLDICNDGTTAIYFSWKVLYDLIRFFFCHESAVVVLNVHSRRLDTL